jgi:hypothetical protein
VNTSRAFGGSSPLTSIALLALLVGCTAEVTGHRAEGDGPGSSGATNGGSGGTASTGAGSAGAAAGGAGGTSGNGTGGAGTGAVPSDCVAATPADPGLSYSRRLTRTEYNNTVRELLGDATAPANAFPAEVLTFNAGTDYFGFDNDPSVQSVPELLADGYFAAAETLATAAVRNLATLVPCSARDRACGEEFVRSFGERAFRRPLASEEVARFMAPFDAGMATDFASGVRLVVTAMLQSAPFLYRIESGTAASGAWLKPTSWEMASRLSYFLWQSMPDEPLFDAARRNELETADQVAAQAARMLDDPKARAMVADFHRQWLGLRGVPHLQKDATRFSAFNESIAGDMVVEADRFIQDIVFDGSGNASELFSSASTFVNGNLASFYGIPNVTGNAFQKVTLDGTRRAGLLTLGAPLAQLAKQNQTSPVLRGKFVREQLLCEHVLPPPADINVMVPELDPNLTTRERFSQHSTDDACAGCHVLMDPIGFGLENYDAVGKWRDTENGDPIDASGSIDEGEGADAAGPFVGPAELGARLASSETVKHCMALNWYRYANGRGEKPADACELETLTARFTASGHDVKALLLALTQTSAFLHRRPGGP